MPLNPQHRQFVFVLTVFAVMAPYLGFAVYFSFRYPSGQWPLWLGCTLAIWFITNFVIIALLARRIFKGQVVDPEKARNATAVSVRTSIRLTIFWSLLFLAGVYEVIRGNIPLSRAIPAGAFLLVFIGIFGWGIYRAKTGNV